MIEKYQMNQLKNSFSLLELDVADDREQTAATAAVADLRESTNGKGKGKKKGNGSGDTAVKKKGNGSGDTTISKNDNRGHQRLEMVSGDTTIKEKGNGSGDTTISKNDKRGQQCLEMVSGDCKLPLVWIDLEMTGLIVEVDRILEIACVVTDGNLTKSFEGPDLVIHQSKACLDRMGEWCQTHHGASGLTEKVIHSAISEQEAEKQVIEFVKRHVGTYKPLLAGNSVYMDFLFLKKYMPELASLFPHVLVDVSSLKALCLRWYPKENRNAPSKENKHRAMDDIKESIGELKYYKENIFKSPKSKK